MKLGFSQQEIIGTAKSLGLPSDGFVQRRVARAFDLVATDKVTEVDDSIFRVHSQYDAGKSYIVNLNGDWGCDCPDHQKHTGDSCKHMIASMIFATGGSFTADDHQKHEANSLIIKDVTEYKRNVRRAWFIIDGERRISVWQDLNGKVCCNCGAYYDGDCEHKRAIREYLNNGGGNGSKVVNECGSEHAEAIQAKLNGQLDSRTGGFVTADNHHDNGNGAQASSQPTQLEMNDPFQECELKDIAQIEGRANGDLVHKLSNGEYVISYRGVMRLAEKHDIEFELATHGETHTIIAKGHRNGSERISGKPINGSVFTAGELAKRNAARQLLPLGEIKAMEKKAKLEYEFDWNAAYDKCAELAGGKPQVDIVINDLVKAGKLRQDSPSVYDRTEWLVIYDACQKEASWVREGFTAKPKNLVVRTSTPSTTRDPKSLNNWSYNSAVFLAEGVGHASHAERCREAIAKVRAEKKVEANEQPLEGGNGKRRKDVGKAVIFLQMDKKLNTWLVEADGTRKAISCREIAMQFDSYEKGIIKQLRTGIECGADISTVELDD